MPAVVLNAPGTDAATAATGPCGGFGKIAAAGDFIRFDVARDFVAAWDAWLQTGLTEARAAMGDRWQGCYMSAPLWRFTLAPGVAGDAAAFGVMMPSTDLVGRLFPLTLVRPVVADQPLAELHFAARAAFEAMEDIALVTLDDLPLEALKTRCAELPAPSRVAAAPPSGSDVLCLPGASDAAPALAALQMPQRPGQCIWSARSVHGLCLLRSDGLPTGARFAALLDADARLWRDAVPSQGAAS